MNNPFSRIEGEFLSEVAFVMDYIQLGFSGPYLTAYTYPVVKIGTDLYAWGDAGYRDALCTFITKTVTKTNLIENEEIQLEFNDLGGISISLRPDDRLGAESATFSLGKTELWVWN